MLDWKHITEKHELESAYRKVLPVITAAAREMGYAIGVHGSMQRDLDLIAVPWDRKARKPETLIMHIQDRLLGFTYTRNMWKREGARDPKPNGRIAYAMMIAWLGEGFKGNNTDGRPLTHAYLDISVMPPSA